MSSRYEVEVTITSATDLKNVNCRHGGKLVPYAVAWVDPTKKCSTRADEHGGVSPRWDDSALLIPFNSPVVDTALFIDVVHVGAVGDTTKPLVGSAVLPLRDVGMGAAADRKLDLTRPLGRPQGKLHVKVTIRDRASAVPNYAPPPYGVAPAGSRDYYAYAPPPPPPAHYGIPYGGTPSGYGGYGAPAVYGQPAGSYYGQQAGEKKSKFGGMGAGLAVGAVAGALGGLTLAEGFDKLEDKITDDVGERVEDDLGYDGDE